jgi:hypothetical protein
MKRGVYGPKTKTEALNATGMKLWHAFGIIKGDTENKALRPVNIRTLMLRLLRFEYIDYKTTKNKSTSYEY